MAAVVGVVEAVVAVVVVAVGTVAVVAFGGVVAVAGKAPERAVVPALVQPGRLGMLAKDPLAGHIVDSSARLRRRPSCSSPPAKENQ